MSALQTSLVLATLLHQNTAMEIEDPLEHEVLYNEPDAVDATEFNLKEALG